MIQFKTLINDWYSKDISRKVRSGVWARKEKDYIQEQKHLMDIQKRRKIKTNQ